MGGSLPSVLCVSQGAPRDDPHECDICSVTPMSATASNRKRALSGGSGSGGSEGAPPAKIERREGDDHAPRSSASARAGQTESGDEAGTSGTVDRSTVPESPECAASKPNLSLMVKWHSHGNGPNRIHHLNLQTLESVDKLEGLSRSLIDRAFSGDRPQHLNNEEYYNFTPTEECMSFPPGTTRTEFKLVTTTEEERKLLITVIEFESTAVMIGHLAVRLSLVAYPLVSVKKTFLDGIGKELGSPNSTFKGILS
eukprot:gene10504-8470_t